MTVWEIVRWSMVMCLVLVLTCWAYQILFPLREPVEICKDALPACTDALGMNQCICICPDGTVYE